MKILLLLPVLIVIQRNIDMLVSYKRWGFWLGFNKRQVSNKRLSQIDAGWLRDAVLIDPRGV